MKCPMCTSHYCFPQYHSGRDAWYRRLLPWVFCDMLGEHIHWTCHPFGGCGYAWVEGREGVHGL